MRPETWLDIQAEHAPERTALIAEGRAFSFSELRDEVRGVAAGLQSAGVDSGSRVSVAFEPGLEYALLIHALMLLGATLCPLDPRDPSARSGYDFVFEASNEVPRGASEALSLVEFAPASPICEITSSGTTGQSKQISLSPQNVFWSALGSAHALGVETDDRWLVCLPLFHVSGLMPIYRALIHGTAVSVHPGFSTRAVAEEISSGTVTGISLVPTALIDLFESNPGVLRQPRVVLVGGAATPTALLEKAISAEVPIAVTYGMTEACSQVTVLPPSEIAQSVGSAGRPLVTTRLRIDQGEILVGGPTVSTGCLDSEGWYRTGDLGRIDSEGRLWIEGRIDEMVITGGENVFPSEIESVLVRHPDVREAVVWGADDARWQQELRAAVVLTAGSKFDQPALLEWCAETLPPHKVPKRIEVIGEIPLGPTGKPARHELTKRSSDDPR